MNEKIGAAMLVGFSGVGVIVTGAVLGYFSGLAVIKFIDNIKDRKMLGNKKPKK